MLRPVRLVAAGCALVAVVGLIGLTQLGTAPAPVPPGDDPAPSRLLFQRLTADGVFIRVRVLQEGRSVLASVSNGRASAELRGCSPAAGLVLAASVSGAGLAEGGPMSALIVRAGPDVTAVTARFASGDSDTMAPIEGWAVLAHSGTVVQAVVEAGPGGGPAISSGRDGRRAHC